MDLCTFVLFDVNICNMILVRNINIFSTTRRNVISFSKSSNCMISYNKLSIIHLNYIPTILRKFVVILSFLILTDNTLGQTLSSFIIYNSISSWNFCLLVFGFIISLENCSLIWRRHHCRYRAANFNLCSALMVIEQWGFFSLPQLLWHGPSFATTRDTHTVKWTLLVFTT